MKRTVKILFIVCCAIVQAQAQPAKEEIQKIRQAYEKSGRLSMEVTYKVYASHHAASPVEVSSGSYKKSGKDFESNFSGIIMLQNSKVLLTVDPEQESILITNPRKTTGFVEGLPMDTLLSVYTRTKVTTLDSKNKRLTLIFNKAEDEDETLEIEKVDFYYNSTTYFLHKLVMFYGEPVSTDEGKTPGEKPRMEIIFSGINPSPAFDKNAFSENLYLIQKGKKFIGISQYAEYEIIDQRIKK